jgi:hypothetical protein
LIISKNYPAQLFEPVNEPLHMGTRTFDHCLYARQSAEQMSLLDLIILYAAFFMLTVEIASDGTEQNLARRVF